MNKQKTLEEISSRIVDTMKKLESAANAYEQAKQSVTMANHRLTDAENNLSFLQKEYDKAMAEMRSAIPVGEWRAAGHRAGGDPRKLETKG